MRVLLNKLKRPPLTGVACEFCGWHGTKEEVHTAKVMNTDSSTYVIQVCPQCLRNGGLIDHDAKHL